MFVLAVVAAVLLVGPSISDLFSALQAPGRVSYYLFLVSHVFFLSKMDTRIFPANVLMHFFLFL